MALTNLVADRRFWVEALAVALAYAVVGALGLLLAIPPDNASPIWPPAGIALAAVLVGGKGVRVGIFLGAAVANFLGFHQTEGGLETGSVLASLGVASGALLQALWGSYLLRRFGATGPTWILESLADVLRLTAVVWPMTLVSSVFGAFCLCLTGTAPWSAFAGMWFTWWLGDAVGVMVAAPLVLSWKMGVDQRFVTARWLEGGAVMVCLAVFSLVGFGVVLEGALAHYPLSYLPLPFLLWAAIRLDQWGATAGLLLVNIIAVCATAAELGPFRVGSPAHSALLLQLFIAVVSVTVLLVAAFVDERREAQEAAEKLNADLEERVSQRTRDIANRNAELERQVGERRRAEDALKAAAERAEAAAERAAEADRSKSHLLDNLPTMVAMAAADQTVTYLNPAMRQGLERVAAHLPVAVGDIVGRPLADIHGGASFLHAVLADPENLPYGVQIHLGDEMVDVVAIATRAPDGGYLGPLVIWEFTTEKARLERDKQTSVQREQAQAAQLQDKVQRILSVVQAAGEGDLTRRVEVGGDDAIGQMGSGLGRFFSELHGHIGVISVNAQRVSDASAALNRTSRGMEGNAGRTAEMADDASANAHRVSQNLQTVSNAVQDVAATVDRILVDVRQAADMARQAVEEEEVANRVFEDLGARSTEIGGVVKLIMAIAEQTNLLALNATIEAARAGEAGKGFAVVANEVKELARETAEATEVIAARAGGIRADTEKAVKVVGRVGGLIRQINDIQTAINGAMEEQARTSRQMAENIAQAADGSASIAESIGGVSAEAQTAAQGAREADRAATEMAEMAAELQAFVSRFKVKGGDGGTSPPADRQRLLEALRRKVRDGTSAPGPDIE